MPGENFTKEGKLITELGGPGKAVGWGFSQEDAIQLAIAHQLKRIADALAVRDAADGQRECPHSPTGRHQVDTSIESGPNNCFHCEAPMGGR